MSNDYTIGVKVTAATDQFKQGMAVMNRELAATKTNFSSFGTSAEEQSKKLHKMLDMSTMVGKGMLVAGAGIAAGIGLVIKTFADYDTALSGFKAASREQDAVVQQVGKNAMAVGQQFGYTAVQALEGATALNKAGVSVADIMGGALSGALTLAATDTMSVADAAETASIAMTQFKLEGKDVGHIADLLAAGAGKAVGSVTDLSMGLKQSGLVASQFGLSLEDTVGTLAAFASKGLIGSDAGTSFKTMLLSLANPSKEAKSRMEELGIAAYDAQGNFVGIAGLAEQLQTKLGGLSQAQRDQTSALLFGNDAIRAANVLYTLGGEGIRGWVKDVDQSGYAAQVAADRLDNLNGDFQKLTTSIQNGFITAGTGANDVMRGLVQGATGLVKWVSDLPTPMLTAAVVTTALLSASLLLSGGLLTAIPRIVAYREAVATLGPTGQRVTGIVGGLGKAMAGLAALGVVVGVIQAIGDAARANGPAVEDFINTLKTGSSAKLLSEILPSGNDDDYYKRIADRLGLASAGAARFSEALDILKERQGSLDKGWMESNFGSIFGVGTQKNIDQLNTFSKSLATLASQGDMAGVRKGFEALRTELNLSDGELQRFIDLSPELRSALMGIANDAGINKEGMGLLKIATGEFLAETAAADGKTAPFNDAMAGMHKSTEDVADELSKLLDLLFETGIKTRDLWTAENDFAQSSADFTRGIEDSIKALQSKYIEQGNSKEAAEALAQAEWDAAQKLDVNTESGRKNREGLIKIADAGKNYVETLITQGKGESDVQAAMQGTYDKLIAAAGQLGITGDAADELARKVMGIPPGVDIKTWMDQQAEIAAGRLKGALDGLDGRVISIYTNEYFNRLEQRTMLPDLNGEASGSGRPGFASGGPIGGSGPKGVDSLWIKAAPGEHMWTAEEVDAVGGQQAVAALRAAALNGGLRSAMFGQPQPATPHWAVQGGGGSHTTVDAGVHIAGDLVAADPKEAIREIRTSQHDALAMSGLSTFPGV